MSSKSAEAFATRTATVRLSIVQVTDDLVAPKEENKQPQKIGGGRNMDKAAEGVREPAPQTGINYTSISNEEHGTSSSKGVTRGITGSADVSYV